MKTLEKLIVYTLLVIEMIPKAISIHISNNVAIVIKNQKIKMSVN